LRLRPFHLCIRRRYSSPDVNRLFLLAGSLVLARALGAQGLPAHQPLNPTSATRTGLYAEPYRAFDPGGGWRSGLSIEYGNAIESDTAGTSSYLLDAELMRSSLLLQRDLSPRVFAELELSAVGAYAGFTDGFFVWYHRLIHYTQPERAARPENVFGYRFSLPDGTTITRTPSALSLGDTRATLGLRHGESLQSVLSLTLPTATGGYGRGVPSVSTVHTVHLELSPRVFYEGTAGVGFTPRHGDLSAYQRMLFASASTGFGFRLWGSQSVFGSFFYHSPDYHGTGLRSLDHHELTADFGWLARGRDGRDWYVSFTEDLGPGDPGIDLILRVGRTW
jgi:hypothetical protein